MATFVGALDAPELATVDERGAVRLADPAATLDWWIGGDDRWHRADSEASVRQYRIDAVPVVETALRVPGGDALQRVYGAAGGLLVIEVENASPAPFVFALVVSGAALSFAGDTIAFGPRRVTAPRPPAASTSGPDVETVWSTVTAGEAAHSEGRGDVHALLFPVAHRTRWRCVVELVDAQQGDTPDLAALPDAAVVARSWDRQLERGMRFSVGDRAVDEAVRCARAELLLLAAHHAQARGPERDDAAPELFMALEDWGFDDEAAQIWDRLTMRQRRVARRRVPPAEPWTALREPSPPTATLRAARSVLIDDRGSTIDIVPGFRADWLGVPLTVEDAPTRSGLVSFALRWHGTRPALLWDAPEGVELRLPILDPSAQIAGGKGERLLEEPPVGLLGLGKDARSAGERFEPESFS